MNESAPPGTDTAPLAAARAYLLRTLGTGGGGQQAAVERELNALAEADSLLGALRAVGGPDAWPHILTVQAERARIVESLIARLSAWRVAGGGLLLSTVATDGAAPVERPGIPATAGDLAPHPDERPQEVDQPLATEAPSVPEPVEAVSPIPEAVAPAPPVTEPVDLREAIEMLRATFAGGGDPRVPREDATTQAKADVATLRALVEPLTLPPDGWLPGPSEWEAELGALDRFASELDERWGGLPAHFQRLLVAVTATLARHLQDLEPAPADERPSHRLDPLFSRLTAFSKEYRPGSVNGLARTHTPKGESWLDDARKVFGELRLEAGLPAIFAPPAAPDAAPAGNADIDIDAFLIDEAFVTEADRALARDVLTGAKLSNPRKRRIAAGKLERARALFREARLRVCADPDCARLRDELYDRSGPSVVVDDAALCDLCGGSDNRRALLLLVRCLRSAGLRRLVVVGGGDDARAELRRTLEEWGIEVREVHAAKGSHSRKEADALMGWADLGVVWGSTQLPHKVSNLFRDPPPGLRMINPNARGITSLCESVIRAVCGA